MVVGLIEGLWVRGVGYSGEAGAEGKEICGW